MSQVDTFCFTNPRPELIMELANFCSQPLSAPCNVQHSLCVAHSMLIAFVMLRNPTIVFAIVDSLAHLLSPSLYLHFLWSHVSSNMPELVIVPDLVGHQSLIASALLAGLALPRFGVDCRLHHSLLGRLSMRPPLICWHGLPCLGTRRFGTAVSVTASSLPHRTAFVFNLLGDVGLSHTAHTLCLSFPFV